MKKFFLTSSAILLISCSAENSNRNSNNWHTYQNVNYNYLLKIPDEAYIPNKSQAKDQVFFGNIKQLEENSGEAFDIQIYGKKDSNNCVPSITGTSNLKNLSNEVMGKSGWGRMDAWDGYGQEGWEYDPKWANIVCKKEGTPAPQEIYVLCAEKDEKTVVICINQMTDNPQLAEEIFKTFRWIDE